MHQTIILYYDTSFIWVRRHLVQIFIRLFLPSAKTEVLCIFGCHWRLVCLME